ncbi:TPA: transporter [Candidatus Azambacteria bacterium]|uniref:TolC family protein n=1 Tax=unclassified Arsukibacterium TaxID=2635278 RepID=UPI000E819B52|nr:MULTISPECIES: TolC family protein [unclassified Arsukibacterium]HAW93649.1 transporter [Candidatus Azambacteria bacterium]|tara:strand:- start:13075 stop:14406 length:1332 start_codon:yes stop_codon:yes gene_type:complete
MNLSNVTFFVVLSLSVSNVIGYAQTFPEPLKLEQAVALAVDADPWLTGSQFTQEALNDEAIAAATLPDPRVSLMAGNFPVDTFDLNQEAMTQLSVGVSQMFPRGDSLALAQHQKQQLAEQHPLLRLDRKAKVSAMVSQLWLEAFKAQESIRLIEHDRALFEQLVDAAEAGYSSALGRARQQDVIRAQLELTRLEDRLTMLRQQQQSAQKRLSEWIGAPAMFPLAQVLPTQSLSRQLSAPTIKRTNEDTHYQWIRHHPALRALEQRINATQTGVDLAKQKYKPEWGLSVQYGYRDNDPLGRDRADLFSVGVTFDLPIFTGNRQDKEVSAAMNRTEAIKTEKQLLGRRLMAELENARVQLTRLDERQALYIDKLLPQMADQAAVSLTAYNNDDGDFAEAVRARIAELNARIDALAIAVERQKIIAQINYLLAEASFDDAQPAKPF